MNHLSFVVIFTPSNKHAWTWENEWGMRISISCKHELGYWIVEMSKEKRLQFHTQNEQQKNIKNYLSHLNTLYVNTFFSRWYYIFLSINGWRRMSQVVWNKLFFFTKLKALRVNGVKKNVIFWLSFRWYWIKKTSVLWSLIEKKMEKNIEIACNFTHNNNRYREIWNYLHLFQTVFCLVIFSNSQGC